MSQVDDELIYLDYNATTPVAKEVADVITECLLHAAGNPSSPHKHGVAAKQAIEKAREQVARIIHAKSPSEIVFLSGGSESVNYAVKGTALAQIQPGGTILRDHIVTSAIEHPVVIESCNYLQKKFGFRVTKVPVDSRGVVDLKALEDSLEPEKTCLVTIMHANNETGVIQPIAEIAKIVKQKCPHAIFHTDASQSVGKYPTNVEDMGVDLLTVAGHKLYGPKGIGALYIRTGVQLDKLIHGAGQESGRRAGTENTPYIAGLGKACELAYANLEKNMAHFRAMRDRLIEGFKQKLQDAVRVNGDGAERLPNTASISFKGIQAADLLKRLATKLAASGGSACHSGTPHISSVLAAMGVEEDWAYGTVRFSTGLQTTEAQIDAAVELVLKELPFCKRA